MKRFLIAVAATVVSALLWYVGMGLRPVPGIAFLAPLPVLLLAPRVAASTAFLTGFLSWLGGVSQFWPYFTGTLQQPPAMSVILLAGTALVYGLVVLLTRALLLRGRPGLAALALPAGWVTLEYLMCVAGPFGAWWSLAYTQTDVLPVLQTAALTGTFGLTFLILLPAAALAALLAPNVTRTQRLRVGGATAVVLVSALAFGFVRLAQPADRDAAPVGLVAVSQPDDYVRVDGPDGRDTIARAVTEIDRLADQGARAVVLPEKTWRADESTLPLLSEPLTEVAARRGITVVAGVALTRTDGAINAAIAYPSGVVYAKHYLVPGLEEEFRAGTQWQDVPSTQWALAVCYDLDRPNLVRTNKNRGATLLLVPALDFTVDHWLHSRMAVTRGVESGIAIARPAQLGELVLSDPTGHVLTSPRAGIDHTATAFAAVSTTTSRTVYARFGDWFSWLAVAATLLCVVGLFGGKRRRP
ncbi:nitrilase-related carbon-nitrogen hydrolase [Nocardia panacis]|uniref:nitrilase-related carbon-nitrogen hydrolase n=1 Tax=Nocardia panacis TaxID=2340916 RepID=UPI00131574AB|nr:nitrilase-related carbon-nitrogen hydrolase [Nocardia panacis]